jgi:hypothetical protein
MAINRIRKQTQIQNTEIKNTHPEVLRNTISKNNFFTEN